jgi:AraC-like DNA-binding protein
MLIKEKGGTKMEFENLKATSIRSIVKYETRTGNRWEASKRSDHILGFVISGNTFHDFGYQKFNNEKDCIFFFNQKEDYKAEVMEKGLSFSIHFTTSEPIETESFCKKVKDTSEIYTLMEHIDRLWQLNPQGDNMTMSYFCRLCDKIGSIYNKPYFSTDKKIRQAKEYIDLHFKEKGCLDEAAKIYGLSRRRFNDRFKVHASCTPNRYVTEKKIALAKELLALQELSVSQTASLCGFSDIYYFSKVFTEEVGIPPSKFRKQT